MEKQFKCEKCSNEKTDIVADFPTHGAAFNEVIFVPLHRVMAWSRNGDHFSYSSLRNRHSRLRIRTPYFHVEASVSVWTALVDRMASGWWPKEAPPRSKKGLSCCFESR